ncbi:MAG: hypothetical protein Q9219_002889 [cf. Caloplaca sp. 3 TL-2023]
MAQQDDKAPMMYAVFSVFLVLPLIAVILRLLARRVSHVSLWWDDWLILVAAVIVILNFVFLHESVSSALPKPVLWLTKSSLALENNAGKHGPTPHLETFLIYTYANEIVYASIVTCIKSSVLCLYLRLFGVNRRFATIVKGFLIVVFAWGIATLLTSIFQCHPVRGAWDLSVPRDRCFSLRTWLIATNVPNIVIDFGIILLPMHLVWRLKLSIARKIGLTAIFLLGIFASIISIVRVHTNTTIKNTDPTWDWVMVMIWSTVEGNVGVICACAPVLAPLVRRCVGRSAATTPRSSKDPPSAKDLWRARPTHRDLSFNRLDEEDTANLMYPGGGNSVHCQTSSDTAGKGGSVMELGSIYVTSNVNVERTEKS